MTQKEEDAPSTATIDRLGSSLPQRTKGVPEGPDYVMDVGRTKTGIINAWSDDVRSVFGTSGFDQLLEIHPPQEEAIAAVTG